MTSSAPQFSVVIPCFNHGDYLHESVGSVRRQSRKDYEIVIVNDGSTDRHTLQVLAELRDSDIRQLHQANSGPAAARNAGIAAARGEFILPLDADDRLAPTFLEKAAGLFAASGDLGIVYGQVEFFGAQAGVWRQPTFSRRRILYENMIVVSAIFRKGDWLQVGGYCPRMVHGWEDWDFWLSLMELGRSVAQIPEVMLYYRILSNSRTRTMSYRQKIRMFLTMLERHRRLYWREIVMNSFSGC